MDLKTDVIRNPSETIVFQKSVDSLKPNSTIPCDISNKSLKFICKECGETFTDERLFWKHLHLTHTRLKTENQSNKSRSSNRKLYTCKECNETFSNESDVWKHASLKHTPHNQERAVQGNAEVSESNLYSCKLCSDTFPLESLFWKHASLVHVRPNKRPIQLVETDRNSNENSDVTKPNITYECKLCCDNFKVESHFWDHVSNEHGMSKKQSTKLKISKKSGKEQCSNSSILVCQSKEDVTDERTFRKNAMHSVDKSFCSCSTIDWNKVSKSLFSCPKCCNYYKSSRSLRRHLRICHVTADYSTVKITSSPEPPTRDALYCPLCSFKALRRELLLHFQEEHDITIEQEYLTFPSLSLFEKWKLSVEYETKAHFAKARANRSNKCGAVLSSFNCHRSGFFRSTGKNIRRIKGHGSNRINGCCPASMKCIVGLNGSVKVQFCKTHVGHEMEVNRMYLSKSERDDIAKKISEGIPFDDILNEVRESASKENLGRLQLLSRKDLYNLKASYNITKESVRTNCNLDNMNSWINSISESNSIIRFFKGTGTKMVSQPNLKEDDFMIVVMNQVQSDFLKLNGSRCICVDGTSDSSIFDFILVSLIVLDENSNGFPCAFLFANKCDYDVLKLFFCLLRDALDHRLQPSVFMSEMDDSVYEAWCSVMYPAQSRLYCTCHMGRTLRKNCGLKISNKAKRSEIYNTLKTVLLEEADPVVSEAMVDELVSSKLTDTDIHNFVECLKHYKDNFQLWAHCFWRTTGINYTVHEKTHKSMKNLNVKCKKIKNLDEAVVLAMKSVWNTFFFKRPKLLDEERAKILDDLQLRHKLAEEISDVSIVEEGNSWNITSTDEMSTYRVDLVNCDCKHCDITCEECSTCVHKYVCSCSDSSLRWNMCQHVHLICLNIISQKNINFTTENAESQDDEIVCNPYVEVSIEDEPNVVASTSQESYDQIEKQKELLLTKIYELCSVIETTQSVEILNTIEKSISPIIPELNSSNCFYDEILTPDSKKIKLM